MRTKKELLGTKYKLRRTGKIYYIHHVREYEHGNHKIYLTNENNSDDELTVYLDDLFDVRFFRSLSEDGKREVQVSGWQNDLLYEIASEVCSRLERMYYMYENKKDEEPIFISDEFFVTPPRQGENFQFGDKLFKVVSVTHNYAGNAPGEIYLKKIKK